MKKIYKEVEIVPIKVFSGVPHTPLSEEDAMKGAIKRARQAIKKTKADFGIGMEGGICKKFSRYFLHGWCAAIDKKGKVGLGGCNRLELPSSLVKKVLKGKELGEVMDEITGMHDIKKKMVL